MSTSSKRSRTIRLALLVALVIALVAAALLSDVRGRFTVEHLRAMTLAAGPAGALLFVALFCVGELLYVPGLVFVVAGVLAFGRVSGGLLSFAAALLSVSVTFALVRGAGGKALAESERPWMRRMMARLDTHPIRAVIFLRLVFQISPPLNYALALSSIRYRDFLIGSAGGLALPIALVALFTEQVARLLPNSPLP